MVTELTVSGPSYLEMATRLLRRARLDSPTGGVWEAADLQWWWRLPRSSDRFDQTFWLDDDGEPVAGLVVTDWGRIWGCDPIIAEDVADLLPTVWEAALDRMESIDTGEVEVTIRDDDTALGSLASSAGLAPGDQAFSETWMDATSRPPVTVPPDGFRLLDRDLARENPHHMIRRNGPAVDERLAQTSMYRPDLDLFIEASDGSIAGYGLFWLDPVTGVGLVEPMRTEEEYQGLGLARCVLTAGIDRLSRLGATRLKISYEHGNDAASHLYLSTGFVAASESRVHVRNAK
jgi:RimJ/RimL family protein N-acetyltransferase